MRLRTLLLIVVLAVIGYQAYMYLTVHLSQDVMVYKRFANAVLAGEASKVRSLIGDPSVDDAFLATLERDELFPGEIRFSFYTVLQRKVSADGRTVELRVRQLVRYDPEGADTYFGVDSHRDIHTVILQRDGSAWKIVEFADTPTQRFRVGKRGF